jgi:CelD/BcsL family acetyltransferase involved in cellulose biosynthesis
MFLGQGGAPPGKRRMSAPAILDRHVDSCSPPADARATARSGIALTVHDDLAAVEADWRAFEHSADCTVFQAFDWLETWYRHLGQRNGVTPAIVIGRRADGGMLFLLPLAVLPGVVRRLAFLGSELCDYNAPLLAPDFPEQVTRETFLALWQEIRALVMGCHRHDLIELTKMPDMVGTQRNPMLALEVGLNPSGAHLTELAGSWDDFYQAKRSSATRRRDRTKRKRLGEFGEVAFVTPAQPDEITRTFETLIAQKSKAFARMGVTNIFAREGCRAFYLDLATNPRTRQLTHVSRLDVGAIPAAVNLGLTFRGTYYHILASYDDGEVSRYGPGAAHLRDLLSHAIALGCTRFDFTIGDERYKLEWSDSRVDLYDHVEGATARGSALAVLILTRRRLVRTIKQNALLWRTFSWLRSTLGGRRATGEDAPPAKDGKSPSIVPE